jgi:DNA-binding GntR family transcriptional regulator
MSGHSSLALVATGSDRPNVSERTYQDLRGRIVDGVLPPGTVLTERRMAALLGVSRTPLRGALSRLEGEGLVERLANGAVVIRRFSIDDLLQILTVRRALEAEAAALATGRISPALLGELAEEARVFASGASADFERFWRHDDRLHDVVTEAAGQPLLAGLVDDMRRKGRMCHAPRMPASFVDQGREHLAVLEALAGDDPDLSRRRMQAHMDAVRGRLVAWLTRAVPA